MPQLRTASLLLLASALAFGCATHHDVADPDAPPVVTVVDPVTSADFPPTMTSFESCLVGGGALVEVASVDNDDTREHGALWTFAVAGDRRIAVAAEDGSIKLWTLDGFVEELDPGAFLYGAEVDGAQVADLAFLDGAIVAGDVRGVVSAWSEGFPRIVGGTDPDISIVAVAVDPERAWVAHADAQAGGNVMVRAMNDPVTIGPLATELVDVTDLAFVNGRLVVAGDRGLELHDRDEPLAVVARSTFDHAVAGVTEVAASGGGELIAFVSADAVGAVDGDLATRWVTATVGAHVPRSVAVAETGRTVFTVGAEGTLRAWAGADGAPLAQVDVADPVAVRLDHTAGLAVVGSQDGVLRAFACR